VTSDRCIPITNTLGWNAVAFCAVEVIHLFFVAFCVVRAVHKIGFKPVITETRNN
jgi:hypothetical protein